MNKTRALKLERSPRGAIPAGWDKEFYCAIIRDADGIAVIKRHHRPLIGDRKWTMTIGAIIDGDAVSQQTTEWARSISQDFGEVFAPNCDCCKYRLACLINNEIEKTFEPR